MSLPSDAPSRAALSQPSALPRPLDFAYPSNRYAVAGMGLGLLSAKALGHSWPASFRIALGTFSSWAISRELDPDASESALAAMPLAFLALMERPKDTPADQAEPLSTLRHALPGFVALSSTRSLAATVGPQLSVQDTVVLGLQAALTSVSSGHVSSLMPGAAMQLVSRQKDNGHFSTLNGLAVLATGALPAEGRSAGSGVVSDLLSLAALGVGAVLVQPEQIKSQCDDRPRKISDERVQAARMLSLGTLALGLLRRESLTLAPLAAACLSVGIRRLLR